MKQNIKIVNKSPNKLPEYMTAGSAGMDLRAWCPNEHFAGSGCDWDDVLHCINLFPQGRVVVHTGLYMSIPKGYEARVQSRSGLAVNDGIFVLNSPGCIDSDYRGEICVILHNTSNEVFTITTGDRIAQLIISPVKQLPLVEVAELDQTNRGAGGFGHTGVK